MKLVLDRIQMKGIAEIIEKHRNSPHVYIISFSQWKKLNNPMKHLLRIGDEFVNANNIRSFVTISFVTSCEDNPNKEFHIGIERECIYKKVFTNRKEAQKECDRINKWLEQFIDYEAEGTSE